MRGLRSVRLASLALLVALIFAGSVPAQNYRSAFDLTNYFGTAQCVVTNGTSASRPKVWSAANEAGGCAQVNPAGFAFENGAPVNPHGILIFPPVPSSAYTRVEFCLLDGYGAFLPPGEFAFRRNHVRRRKKRITWPMPQGRARGFGS